MRIFNAKKMECPKCGNKVMVNCDEVLCRLIPDFDDLKKKFEINCVKSLKVVEEDEGGNGHLTVDEPWKIEATCNLCGFQQVFLASDHKAEEDHDA